LKIYFIYVIYKSGLNVLLDEVKSVGIYTKKYIIVIAAVVIVALVSAFVLSYLWMPTGGIGSRESATTTLTTTSPATRVTTTLSGVVNGAGATFLNPQMQAWASKFYELTGGRIQVNYQSIGSGAGQAKFREGVLDFAGSDPPLKSDIYNEFKAKGGIIQFPVIIGTIVIVYNIPGVESGKLRLTGEVVAKIYLGEISYWDDPAIKALNPDLNLPHEKIIAVHRSDGSGTTRVFTAYLSKVSEAWKSKVGSDFTVSWPVDELGNGVGAKGNEGVAAAVKQNPYSIGYVETAYAYSTGLAIALIRNRDGNYVLPTKEAVASAAEALVKVLPKADEDWSHIFPDQTVDPPGKESYPITSFSFVILRQVYDDPVKAAILKEFFEWVLTEGQRPENIVEGYDPLPPEVAAIGLDGLKLLRTG
jgi:phosphate transport system substrate-binding protein